MASMIEVISAISSERNYQKRRWGRRQHDGTFVEQFNTVGNFVVYMRHYLAEAEKALSTKSGPHAALEELRKVVTLGVACFEQHGIRMRPSEGPVINGHDQVAT